MASEKRDAHERDRYVQLMSQSFTNIRASLLDEEAIGIVFASTEPDAWATLIEGLLNAKLVSRRLLAD